MTHYTGRGSKLESGLGATITSKEIKEQTETFLLKKGAKIEVIEEGFRGDPLVPITKRTPEEIKRIYNRGF